METQAPASENLASSAVKAKYRVTNWPEYDRALVQRGSLTVWFDEEFVTGPEYQAQADTLAQAVELYLKLVAQAIENTKT